MSLRMYEPDTKSRIYLYILLFTASLIGWAVYIRTRPLVIDSECGEIARKTAVLTQDFRFDPNLTYEAEKTKCVSDVLSSKSKTGK